MPTVRKALIQAYEAARKQDKAATKKYLTRAVHLDQANGTVYQAAIIQSTAGDPLSAEQFLKSGWKKIPAIPSSPTPLRTPRRRSREVGLGGRLP